MFIQVNTSAQNVANVVRAVVIWQYTGEVIQDRNHLNVLFVANDSRYQVALLPTTEFTVERNRTNVHCVTKVSVRHATCSHMCNHAKCCMDGKKIRCLQIVSQNVPIYLQ